jgi:uncharacterized protein YqgC (DUF456 family)
MGEFAASALAWTGWSLWCLLSCAACFSIFLSLPGGWIALGLAVLYDLIHGFHAIGWKGLGLFAGLLVVSEIIEAGLGTLYVAKKGATRYGMIGAFVGGIVGAVFGSSVMPLVGTILGGIAGAFAGAVGGEYWREKKLEPSLRIGMHATVGKVLSMSAKFALALAGGALVLWLALPNR